MKREAAAAIAAHLGTEHTQLTITEQDAKAVLPKLSHMFGTLCRFLPDPDLSGQQADAGACDGFLERRWRGRAVLWIWNLSVDHERVE